MSDDGPTRVRPGSEPQLGEELQATVPRGRDRNWERAGMNVTVSVTLSAKDVRWARGKGYVLSRVLRDALDKLRGSNSIEQIDAQIRRHHEELAILNLAREKWQEINNGKDAGLRAEQAKQTRILELATEFWTQRVEVVGKHGLKELVTRDRLPARNNLAQAEAWIRRFPELKGMQPAEVLELVLSLRPPGEAR